MFKLIIVRHGETMENQRGICQGQSEGILSDNGRKKNIFLAKRISHYEIDALFSSPLKRAVETGMEIINYHKNLTLQIDQRLTERDMGVLQGRKFPVDYEVSSVYEGMESLDNMKLRLALLLTDLEKKYANQTILLLSHGVTIAVLMLLLKISPHADFDKMGLIDNSSFIEYVYGENRKPLMHCNKL